MLLTSSKIFLGLIGAYTHLTRNFTLNPNIVSILSKSLCVFQNPVVNKIPKPFQLFLSSLALSGSQATTEYHIELLTSKILLLDSGKFGVTPILYFILKWIAYPGTGWKMLLLLKDNGTGKD
jgi:hypothetical protein